MRGGEKPLASQRRERGILLACVSVAVAVAVVVVMVVVVVVSEASFSPD